MSSPTEAGKCLDEVIPKLPSSFGSAVQGNVETTTFVQVVHNGKVAWLGLNDAVKDCISKFLLRDERHSNSSAVLQHYCIVQISLILYLPSITPKV